ncbi:succinyl-diaminopimelate desuccinylase, partial [Piscirickettsia salmonis]
QLSTAGGTSDGRFIAPYGISVVELGVPNKTIHQVNECVHSQDIIMLSAIYEAVLEKILAKK